METFNSDTSVHDILALVLAAVGGRIEVSDDLLASLGDTIIYVEHNDLEEMFIFRLENK